MAIWQFGSNAALRERVIDGIEAAARAGIARIRAAGADIILVDLQCVPLIGTAPLKDPLLRLMRDPSAPTDVALFRRYDLMRGWKQRLGAGYTRMFASDRLHMNENSYYCMAASLAQGIHRAVTSDRAPPRRRRSSRPVSPPLRRDPDVPSPLPRGRWQRRGSTW